MTREVLSSYPTLELPTINGDSGVWGQVLNSTLQQLDDYIKANETDIAAAQAQVNILNADSNTSGSVDNKIALELAALRGNSTSTIEDLEGLIGEAGNIDLSSITTSITNLQQVVGVVEGVTISPALYPRVSGLELAATTMIGTTAGDEAKSIRTIASEVVAAADTGISESEALVLINNAVAAVQGNTTQTIASLLAMIQTLQTQVAQLQQDVANLQTQKASASSVTGLENTVYGTAETTGLVASVVSADLKATTAKATADQAALDVVTLTGTVNGAVGRIVTLENAGFITQTALAPYATQTWVSSNFITSAGVDTKLLNYATKSYVTTQGYITSSALSGYATQAWVLAQGYTTGSGFITTSDTNWKKVRGLFEGVADSNRILPYSIFLSHSSGSSWRNKIATYTDTNELFQVSETTSGGSRTFRVLVNRDDVVTSTDSYYRKLKAMFDGPTSSEWSNGPTVLHLQQSTDKYIRLDVNIAYGTSARPQVWLYYYAWDPTSGARYVDLKQAT